MFWRGFHIAFLIGLGYFTTKAQLCQGNLSDPVFTIDFGSRGSSGPTYGPALPAGQTTYIYNPTNNLVDGEYNISDRANNGRPEWHNSPDHTVGDVNGYMLIVNASNTAGEFYRTRVTDLCENTLFEFSAWVLNALPPTVCGGSGIDPDIRFEIRNTNGTLLDFNETGPIPESSSGTWEQFGVSFTTDPGVTEVDVIMINNAPGGCGNDLAIDDIEVRACGDIAEITAPTGAGSFCANSLPASLELESNLTGNVYTTPEFLWQESTDGISWNTIAGETNSTISISPIINGNLYRYRVAETAGNLSNSNCSIISDVFQVSIFPNFEFIEDEAICDSETFTMPDGSVENTSGTYNFNYTTINGCDSNYTINLTVNPTFNFNLQPTVCDNQLPYILPDGSMVNQAGQYFLEYNTANGCDSNYNIDLTILPTSIDTTRVGICDGLPYTLPDGSVIAPVTGFYPVTLTANNGCDSTIVTRIRVDSIYAFLDTVEICEGQSHTLIDGTEVSEANDYEVRYLTSRNCDSIYFTHLIVHPSYTDAPVEVTICENESYILPDGSEVFDSGDYPTLLTTQLGCDSLVITSLFVAPTYEVRQEITICGGDEYITPSGTVLTRSGIYRDTLTSAFNCDSIIITQLDLLNVEFPTSFSPNGDGINETFRGLPPQDCSGFVTEFEIRIFNRWGEKVFESNSFDTPWIGNNRPDVYLWETRYTFDGQTFQKQGTVALIF